MKINLKLIKSAYRRTWGVLKPVTRVVPSKKLYDRKKAKRVNLD